ncbi:TPA: hypothetical protein ACRZ2U_003188 [Vibrio harveyi]
MEPGYEIYYVLFGFALLVGVSKLIPALAKFEKQRKLDDEKQQYRKNEERRREELHQATLEQIKKGKVASNVSNRRTSNKRPNNKRGKPANSATLSRKPDGIEGKLIDYGRANYQNKQDENESFFVTLLVDGLEKTIWGKGLAEAVSDLERGQSVSLKRTEKEKVEVEKVTKDDSGKVIKREMVPTYRQGWVGKAI